VANKITPLYLHGIHPRTSSGNLKPQIELNPKNIHVYIPMIGFLKIGKLQINTKS
jgi:hypothetical protein